MSAQSNTIDELGEAICMNEYESEFDVYYDGTLYCKPYKEDKYDGIKIRNYPLYPQQNTR